jgi:two-component system cell cycle sensor histidine kinase/response regulator CckA
MSDPLVVPLSATDANLPGIAIAVDGDFRVRAASLAAAALFPPDAPLIGSDLRECVAERSRGQIEGLPIFLRHSKQSSVVLDLILTRGSGFPEMNVRLAVAPTNEEGAGAGTGLLFLGVDVGDLAPKVEANGAPPRIVAVSRFAGGVAHDFNNVLQTVLGRATLLRHRGLGAEAREHLDELIVAAQKAQRLVQQLLSFGRQQTPSPVRLGFDAIVRRVAESATESLPPQIEVVVDCGAPNVDVVVDLSHLEQVVGAIVENAVDAMSGRGTLTIRTELISRDDAMARDQSFVPAGMYACLSISDTGTGIDDAVLPHIFEPFFTTKEPARSSGMGLAEAYGVVKQSGGFILVDTVKGKGTRLRILFPPALAPVGMDDTNRTVLVVDDDDSVRKVVVTALRQSGFHVLDASSSAEAFLRCELHPANIDLLLSDLTLAGVPGPVLAARLRRQYPRMRVLIMSGSVPDAASRVGGEATIAKPFSIEELLSAVRDALASPERQA